MIKGSIPATPGKVFRRKDNPVAFFSSITPGEFYMKEGEKELIEQTLDDFIEIDKE